MIFLGPFIDLPVCHKLPYKFLVNTSINPYTCIYRSSNKELLVAPNTKRYIQATKVRVAAKTKQTLSYANKRRHKK